MLQAWRCAPEDSGQVQLLSSPRGQCTLCKISVHLNWPHTVLHLNRTHVTAKSTCHRQVLFAVKFVPSERVKYAGACEIACGSEIRLRRVGERISFHILRSKIFHNSRSELFHIRRMPNISLKAFDSEVFRNFVDAFRSFQSVDSFEPAKGLKCLQSCGIINGIYAETRMNG